MKKFGLILLVVASSATAQQSPPWETYQPTGEYLQPAVIPKAFQAEWVEDLEFCGTGLSDTRLVITGNTMSFYESDGEVVSVLRHNSRAITVTASYAGEGQVWDSVDRLVLSRSQDQMTITSGDQSFTRQRCK